MMSSLTKVTAGHETRTSLGWSGNIRVPNEVAGPYRVQVLRTREEVEALREFWDSCSSGRDADLDFYLFIIDLSSESLRPHVVVLYDGKTPKALLAGRLDESQVPVKVGYFALPVPKMRILRFVHGGCLGELTDGTASLLVGSIIESLAAREADAAWLEHVDINSPLIKYAGSLPSWMSSDHLIYPAIHRIRELSEEGGAFVARRYQQRQRVNKLLRDFPNNRIERFNTADKIAQLVRDVENVAQRSYQRGLGVGFSETPFVEARLQFEARKGWLRAYILYLDEKPCAFWIGSLRNQVFLSDFLGFDPAYAEYSPGQYLLTKALEETCGGTRDGLVTRIDFGLGDASYKERLSNHCYEEAPVYIFAPRIKAVGVNALRSAAGATNRSAKYLLQAMPWLGNVKRKWRAKLARKN